MYLRSKISFNHWLKTNVETNLVSIFRLKSKSKAAPITIAFYVHTRAEYLLRTLLEFSKIKELNQKLYLCFFYDSRTNQNDLLILKEFLRKNSFHFDFYHEETYWKKVLLASHSKSQAILKWDEDIYMSNYHLQLMISRIMNGDWDEFDVLAPVVSTGIPTCELFLDLYTTNEVSVALRQEFSNVVFEDWWGSQIAYSSLNGKYNPYNWLQFFKFVHNLDHQYKGMHPIRMSAQAQNQINEFLLENRFWMDWSPKEEIIVIPSSPYFCNSIFACSPKFLKRLVYQVKSKELFFDGYDELPLNQMLNSNSRRIGYLAECLAVHPSYNSIGDDFVKISDSFFSRI